MFVVFLACLGTVAMLIWLGVFFHPARPWDFQPVGDDEELPPPPPSWPSVCILVPARNEREALPHTLPALLRQDYPGEFTVILIDDRSEDGTGNVARKIAEGERRADRLRIVNGADLPPQWIGKVWALEQGACYCGVRSAECGVPQRADPSVKVAKPQYLLLTDADICHAPNSLQRLVRESERAGLALNSRMARLRCMSGPERLLIPPFVFFFNLLYPMRQVNDPAHSLAAAAGGCILLQTAALERLGSFSCIKDCIIDDVNLARQIKRLKDPIQLALSRTEIVSRRVYESVTTIWVMVRRTAFTELRYSWLRLAGTLVGLTLMFVVPPFLGMVGLGMTGIGVLSRAGTPSPWALVLFAEGFVAWAVMAIVYYPAIHFFKLSVVRCWTLPLAGILYGFMTIDSALRYVRGKRVGWRDQ
jgi:hopene-associated glycosyltransferase HpnB